MGHSGVVVFACNHDLIVTRNHWCSGVLNGDGLHCHTAVTAFVSGSERPNNSVRLGTVSHRCVGNKRHFYTTANIGSGRILKRVLLAAFCGVVRRDRSKFWGGCVLDCEGCDGCTRISTIVRSGKGDIKRSCEQATIQNASHRITRQRVDLKVVGPSH